MKKDKTTWKNEIKCTLLVARVWQATTVATMVTVQVAFQCSIDVGKGVQLRLKLSTISQGSIQINCLCSYSTCSNGALLPFSRQWIESIKVEAQYESPKNLCLSLQSLKQKYLYQKHYNYFHFLFKVLNFFHTINSIYIR